MSVSLGVVPEADGQIHLLPSIAMSLFPLRAGKPAESAGEKTWMYSMPHQRAVCFECMVMLSLLSGYIYCFP